MKPDDAPAIKTPQQEARSLAQRQANRLARERGLPLSYPNIWDALDPTKIDPEDATPEAITRSYREFCKLCPPRKRKRHTLVVNWLEGRTRRPCIALGTARYVAAAGRCGR